MEWPLYQSIDDDYEANGVYNYLPYFHKKTVSLLDYFDDETKFICIGDIAESLDAYEELIISRHSDFQMDQQPMISPDDLFFKSSTQIERIVNGNYSTIHEKKVLEKDLSEKNHDSLPISFLLQNIEQSELTNIYEFKAKNNLSKLLLSIPNLLKECTH